jgi:hypothetical protein
VTQYANPSEIGRDKLYYPDVRPITLVAGGLARGEGLHPRGLR